MAITDLNKKSILFEIINREKPGIPVEGFILIIPPESLEIEEPHRVSRTKTWGGVFVDDYGPDNMKITLSGNTGGVQIRRTYAMNDGEDFDGKSAFFYFRDRIMRYKDRLSRQGKAHQDYDLVYYDLSTIPDVLKTITFQDVVSRGNVEAYVVSLEKFKMTRNREKPLFYNYTIELETLRSLGTYTEKARPPIEIDKPTNWLIELRRGLNSIQAVFNKVRQIKSQVETWIDLAEEVTSKITSFFEQGLDILTYPLGLVKRLLGTTRNIVTTLDEIPDATLDTVFRTRDDALSCVEIMKQIEAAICSLVVYGKTPEARGLEIIPSREAMSRLDTMITEYRNLTDGEAQVKDLLLDEASSVFLSDNMEIYGYITVIADSSTTLEGLASEYYADPSLSELIAVVNEIKGNEDIVLGMTIKIPVILQGGAPSNNFIYEETLRDVYGSDIKIDAFGNIVVAASGDLKTIEGMDNLIQALNLRLNTELGSRLRLTVYGIRSAVGNAMTSSPISYILANIKDTVMQDPRVADIQNIKMRGVGDSLYFSFDIATIKINEVIPYSGNV